MRQAALQKTEAFNLATQRPRQGLMSPQSTPQATLIVFFAIFLVVALTLSCSNSKGEKEKEYPHYSTELVRKATNSDAEAQCDLGNAYMRGLGVEKNEKEAFRWMQKSAEQGNADAQLFLGEFYYYGLGVAQNFTEAVKWYNKAAVQGNAQAQNILGGCYQSGTGVKKT